MLIHRQFDVELFLLYAQLGAITEIEAHLEEGISEVSKYK